MTTEREYTATKPTRDDFDEWSKVFKAYIDFYKSSIPEEQYQKTFDRIIDEENDLHALVLRREIEGVDRIIGLAHFFPHQTPWSEEKIMLLNDLFVDPTYRGKGQGRFLIEEVARIAKELGCFRLQWLTKHDNTTARALYDRLAESEFVAYRMSLK